MSLIRCPECRREVSTRTSNCPGCGCPMSGKQRDASKPAQQKSRFNIVSVDCPHCKGTGKLRDKSLLPWNNMASFFLLLGIAGVVGSACLDDNAKALLIGGFVCSGMGITLYVMGDQCPTCNGEGKLHDVDTGKSRKKTTTDENEVNYIGVRDDHAMKPTGVYGSGTRRRNDGPRRDTSRRRNQP